MGASAEPFIELCLLGASLYGIHWFYGVDTYRREPAHAGLQTDRIHWGILEVVYLILFYFFVQPVFMLFTNKVGSQFAFSRFKEEYPLGDGPVGRWIETNPFPPMESFDFFLGTLALAPVSLLTLVLTYLMLKRTCTSPLSSLGLLPLPNGPSLKRLILLGLCIPLPLGFLAMGWEWFLKKMEYPYELQGVVQDYMGAVKQADFLVLGTLTFFAIIVAPIVEEVLFRGLIYGFLRKYLNPALATLITSAGFSVVHANVAASIPIFVLSCFFCMAYEKRSSLFDAIGLHCFFNSISLVFTVITILSENGL